MKKTFILIWFLALSVIITSSSCSSDDDDSGSNTNATEILAIENTMESGNWRVTYFFDTDSEETSNYNSYNFSFDSDGTLTATNVTNTYTGTWSVTNSSSSSSDDIDFNILFSAPADFAELSDDWDIIAHTSTKIELTDVSGGNGGIDFLTFQKN